MEFKVREVDGNEEKSLAEKEQEILDKHEEKEQVTEEAVQKDEVVETELSEEKVLKFLGNRYGREITSFDDLVKEKELTPEMPEDVAAYLKYKKETGRGIDDYVRLNRDFGSMNENSLLREYYKATEDGLDNDDIDIMMEEFSYDEELDDESEVKKKKLAKKKIFRKAEGVL